MRLPYLLFERSLLAGQDAADLVRPDLAIHHSRDFLERQPQVFERQNAVELGQLVERIVAIAGEPVQVIGFEQPQPVLVPQGFDRHLGQPGKLANLEHYIASCRSIV